MAHIKRKYIDSHWLVFFIQGVLALLFGWVALFNSGNNLGTILSLVSIFLLCLSIVEFTNALNRASNNHGWFVSVFIAMIDAIVALVLLFTLEQNTAWHLLIIAGYTLVRGICEIIMAFKTTVDPTDRFIWLICGMCGAIMGIVTFNAGNFESSFFIRFFGAYLLILGACSLIYAIDNRNQKLEDSAARAEAAKAKKALKAAKTTKATKAKTAKKTSAKKK